MTIQDLQENLRAHIRARIEREELTGSGLSHAAGLQQSHLSNFLNSRRGLSLESMDRLLATLRMEVLDLADGREIQRRAQLSGAGGECENVPLVSAERAARVARFTRRQIDETASFRTAFLRRLRPHDIQHRADWLRFALVRLDARATRALFLPHAKAATVLIDRHYNSLRPYRSRDADLYAVRFQARCLVGYVSLADGHLVVRPRHPEFPLEMARLDGAGGHSDCLIGRVCHIGLEL